MGGVGGYFSPTRTHLVPRGLDVPKKGTAIQGITMKKLPKKRAKTPKDSEGPGEKHWPDPLAKKRWPWMARVWEAEDLLEAIGEPFVRVVQTGPTSKATYCAWRRADISRYGKLPSADGQLARFKKLCNLLRTAPFRKLPPDVHNWIHDVKEQSLIVAKVAADIEGCIHYLEKQIAVRQSLITCLTNLGRPELSPDLDIAVRTDCANHIRLLGDALKQARKAEAHLAPCKERFLDKRSSSRKQEEQWLREMVEKFGQVTRNRSAQLAHELLTCIDEYRITKADTLREGSYDIPPRKV